MLLQADKQTGGNSSLVTHSLSSIPMVVQVLVSTCCSGLLYCTVVQLVHPYRQPALPNHCARYNGHCTHLCLPAPQVWRALLLTYNHYLLLLPLLNLTITG